MRSVVVVLALVACAVGARAQEWRALGTFDEATVETMTSSSAPVRVRASRQLPLGCEPVMATLKDIPSFSKWIDFSGWDVVADERAHGGVITMHGRHAMPFPFSPRDYVVDYAATTTADTFTLVATSTQKGPAVANGTVRLRVRSSWSLQLNPEPIATSKTCLVSYEYDGDLGGSFPHFLLEGAFKHEGPRLLAAVLAEARKRGTKP